MCAPCVEWCESTSTCQPYGNSYCSNTYYSRSACPATSLNAGAIVGIVFGALAFVACVVALVLCQRRRRRLYYQQQNFAVITPVYGAPQPLAYAQPFNPQQPPQYAVPPQQYQPPQYQQTAM